MGMEEIIEREISAVFGTAKFDNLDEFLSVARKFNLPVDEYSNIIDNLSIKNKGRKKPRKEDLDVRSKLIKVVSRKEMPHDELAGRVRAVASLLGSPEHFQNYINHFNYISSEEYKENTKIFGKDLPIAVIKQPEPFKKYLNIWRNLSKNPAKAGLELKFREVFQEFFSKERTKLESSLYSIFCDQFEILNSPDNHLGGWWLKEMPSKEELWLSLYALRESLYFEEKKQALLYKFILGACDIGRNRPLKHILMEYQSNLRALFRKVPGIVQEIGELSKEEALQFPFDLFTYPEMQAKILRYFSKVLNTVNQEYRPHMLKFMRDIYHPNDPGIGNNRHIHDEDAFTAPVDHKKWNEWSKRIFLRFLHLAEESNNLEFADVASSAQPTVPNWTDFKAKYTGLKHFYIICKDFYKNPEPPGSPFGFEADTRKTLESLAEKCLNEKIGFTRLKNLLGKKEANKTFATYKQVFSTIIDQVFVRKNKTLHKLGRYGYDELQTIEGRYEYNALQTIEDARKGYMLDTDRAIQFFETFPEIFELYAKLSSPEHPRYWKQQRRILRAFTKTIQTMTQIDDRITLHFILNRPNTEHEYCYAYQTRSLRELALFAEDAALASPGFSVKIFDDYMNHLEMTADPAEGELATTIQEVQAYRDDKTEIRQKVIAQIKEQLGNPVIKLNIPDKMYTLKSQVEAWREVAGDEDYIKGQEHNEDDFIIKEVLPRLTELWERNLEIITLGCGTGVSEIKVAKAMADQQERMGSLDLYLTDVNERMLNEARLNAYRYYSRAIMTIGKHASPNPLDNDPLINPRARKCNFLDSEEVKQTSFGLDERRIFLLLGGTVGNFPAEVRKKIYSNVYKAMKPGDALIVTCGVKPDPEHYRGKSTAQFLFAPLKAAGLQEHQIAEFKKGMQRYECDVVGNRIVGSVSLNRPVKVSGVQLKKGTLFEVLYSDRIDPESFKKELDMFELHGGEPILTDGSRAIAVCYKKAS
ncbi:L-histidine N(alpha)-methyltransferase [Candidatus Woesearchaeota archaeon]|nr:L-histidine N(alpha)-methyltransferase [Candidatus Woesearchaeota archaeon]MBW3005949.1 L-histidine N(alpha)-methyltransferase [Candidatus Woesearchaeota archaeon]